MDISSLGMEISSGSSNKAAEVDKNDNDNKMPTNCMFILV